MHVRSQLRQGAHLARLLKNMAKGRVHLRYRVEASAEDPSLWAIIDVFTGEPAVFLDQLLDHLELEEAHEAADLMNLRDLRRRGIGKL